VFCLLVKGIAAITPIGFLKFKIVIHLKETLYLLVFYVGGYHIGWFLQGPNDYPGTRNKISLEYKSPSLMERVLDHDLRCENLGFSVTPDASSSLAQLITNPLLQVIPSNRRGTTLLTLYTIVIYA
jgi:hypothetical protein